MSVISEKTHCRMYSHNHYEHKNGFNSSRSDIEINQRSYLLPKFSAAASEVFIFNYLKNNKFNYFFNLRVQKLIWAMIIGEKIQL